MLNLLLRAAGTAAGLLARSPVGRIAVSAAEKAGTAFKDVSRSAVQKCQWWARNRGIRMAYNARKRILKQELAEMKKLGKNSEEMAERAYGFRRQERLEAREAMRRNGDMKSVEALERRDAEKYGSRNMGDKDGPNFEGLQFDARSKLVKQLGREPTRDEVFDYIIDSATRTDVVTNVLFLSF